MKMTEAFPLYANNKFGWIKGKFSCPLAATGSPECLTLVSVTFKSNGNKILH